ncbi:MAG: hypothetical protein Hyperionvirus8_18 [Hyperionvirus sp.]|uniref:Uncharacterized protein n=1 Tax=Hyperionvirus sp. TaxID=2487770 RepID=A0A3G5AAG9_9VIRU|nr:MAG: hypothetical protein Hyperionvirus8_18 [Hyperionvirus sp.]
MIEERVVELEKKVMGLGGIKGYKESIAEYNKIEAGLKECVNELNTLESIVENVSCESPEIVTDEKYVLYMNEITSLVEIFDELPIHEQIDLYKNAMVKIRLCDNFLKCRRSEIIYLDKKL